MAYNQLNYLTKVKYVQTMISELHDESAGFGTLAWMWNKLRKDGRFFESYQTFLKYASESRVNERITKLKSQK